MCHFLKPLKITQELSQKISYSSELWYDSCFYDVYYGTAKKRRQNCQGYRDMTSDKKNRRFSAVATVSPPFLRSSLINIIKATVIPKLTAVTHFLTEFLR